MVSGTLAGDFPRIGAMNHRFEIDVVLMPSSLRVSATAMLTRDADTNKEIFPFWGMPETFIDQLSQSSAFAIEAEGKRLFEVQFRNPAKAVADLRACYDTILKKWGVDTAALASLKRKPKPVQGAEIVSSYDYPAVSVRRREQGTTIVRFTVGDNGRVKDCAPVVSSGYEALDHQSCESLRSRGRFEPALDAQGKIVAAETTTAIRWALGTDP